MFAFIRIIISNKNKLRKATIKVGCSLNADSLIPLSTHSGRILDDAILDFADMLNLAFNQIANFKEFRWLAVHANTSRGAGQDNIAWFQCDAPEKSR